MATTRCAPPLGLECPYPADEAARIEASFLPPERAARPLCVLHVTELRLAGFRLQLLTGFARDVALGLVRPAVIDGLPIHDMAPGEVVEAFGK